MNVNVFSDFTKSDKIRQACIRKLPTTRKRKRFMISVPRHSLMCVGGMAFNDESCCVYLIWHQAPKIKFDEPRSVNSISDFPNL